MDVQPNARHVTFSEKLRLKYPNVFSHVPLASVSSFSLSPSLPKQSRSLILIEFDKADTDVKVIQETPSRSASNHVSRAEQNLVSPPRLSSPPLQLPLVPAVHHHCHCHYFVLCFGGSKTEHGLYLSTSMWNTGVVFSWLLGYHSYLNKNVRWTTLTMATNQLLHVRESFKVFQASYNNETRYIGWFCIVLTKIQTWSHGACFLFALYFMGANSQA